MKRKTVRLIVGILVLVIAFGVIAAFVAQPKEKSTKKISDFAFFVGGIGPDGKYVERNDAVYTKEPISALDLKITPDYTFQGSYQVFYYDVEDNFLYSSSVQTSAYSSCKYDVNYSQYRVSKAADKKADGTNGLFFYARVMIIPTLEEGEKINFLEPSLYAKNITIENSVLDFEVSYNLLSNDQLVENKGDFVDSLHNITCEKCTLYDFGEFKDYDFIMVVSKTDFTTDYSTDHSHSESFLSLNTVSGEAFSREYYYQFSDEGAAYKTNEGFNVYLRPASWRNDTYGNIMFVFPDGIDVQVYGVKVNK